MYSTESTKWLTSGAVAAGNGLDRRSRRRIAPQPFAAEHALAPNAARSRDGAQCDEPSRIGNRFYWLAGIFLLARSDSFAALEGFDQRYSLCCENFDLSVRAFNAGDALVHVRKARVIHNVPARQPPLVAPPSTACERFVEGLVFMGILGGRAFGSAHAAHAQAAGSPETLIAT
jgi:hypothetical protein